MFQSCFCTKHCFIIPSPPQFEEVCNIYSCSSVHILQMRKEVQRNLLRVTMARHWQTGSGLSWFLFTMSYCFFSKRKLFSLGYCCCFFSYLFGAKNMESAIFISKHLCTLLSPGRFKAQIGFYVERLAGGALLHVPNARWLNWLTLPLSRAETNFRPPPKFHETDDTQSNEQTLETGPAVSMHLVSVC